MTDRPDFEGDEAGRCGGCGSREMVFTKDGQHAACLMCHRLQEPETRDWPASEMCDNCAFRKGSPERADPYRWAELQDLVAGGGGMFHCHKGLNMKFNAQGDAVFDPPDHATGRVTVCAGWIGARLAHMKRQIMAAPDKVDRSHRARGGFTGGV